MRSDTEILAGVARALNGSVDVDEALVAVLNSVAEHLGLSTGWVWVAETNDSFRLGAARRLPEGLQRDPTWTQGDCWCQTRFRDGALTGGDVELLSCSRLNALEAGDEGLRYHATLALEADGERLGIMNIASRDGRELSDDELRLLRAVSDMLAVALVRARLYERSLELGALRERTRMSREIHDGIAQTLTALVLRLEAIGASETTPDLERALDLARAGLRDTRDAVMQLRESPFDDGLELAVRGIVTEAESRGIPSITVDVEITAEPTRRVTHAGCRILQEALNNVARHAVACPCRVSVQSDSHGLTIEVVDEGRGFDADEAQGFGLLGMRERARLVGAALSVDSDEHGTTVRFEWRAP